MLIKDYYEEVGDSDTDEGGDEAAVAADTGEPVHPSEAEIVATLRGRSGLTFSLRAISAMIGSSA